jgi:homoserine kinase
MRLRLPATSANLGPAFDAAAIALDLYLEIEAQVGETEFSLRATGRNHAECGVLEGNLLLETYKDTLSEAGRKIVPLSLQIVNEIPIGMGLGSSAAARLAGVVLANHFGDLDWDGGRILQEACEQEGHPDNAAACWLGGFVTSVVTNEKNILSARFNPSEGWLGLIVLPETPLATTRARSVLPQMVSRVDAIANVQRAALLTAAFAQGRADWLGESMNDRLHQPYRMALCPLLPRLLPLAGKRGVLGVALSGAGPAVLCVMESAAAAGSSELTTEIRRVAGEPVEIVTCCFTAAGARDSYLSIERV